MHRSHQNLLDESVNVGPFKGYLSKNNSRWWRWSKTKNGSKIYDIEGSRAFKVRVLRRNQWKHFELPHCWSTLFFSGHLQCTELEEDATHGPNVGWPGLRLFNTELFPPQKQRMHHAKKDPFYLGRFALKAWKQSLDSPTYGSSSQTWLVLFRRIRSFCGRASGLR